MAAEVLAQALISGLLWGSVYALIAIGLTLIFGVMDVVNFAHGEFLMAAMYVAYWLGVWRMPAWASVPAVTLFGFGLGLLAFYLLVRRLLQGPMLAQIVGTFGLLVFLRGLAHMLFSADFRSVPQPWVQGRFELFGVFVPTPQLVAGVGSLAMTFLVYWLIHRTEFGWALMAVSENRQAASLVGVPVGRMYALAWGIGGACVGLAGALLTNFYYVFPEVGAIFGVLAYVTVALGGFGSVLGASLAGAIIGLVEALSGLLLSPTVKYVVVFLMYLAIMVVRPRGLLGHG